MAMNLNCRPVTKLLPEISQGCDGSCRIRFKLMCHGADDLGDICEKPWFTYLYYRGPISLTVDSNSWTYSFEHFTTPYCRRFGAAFIDSYPYCNGGSGFDNVIFGRHPETKAFMNYFRKEGYVLISTQHSLPHRVYGSYPSYTVGFYVLDAEPPYRILVGRDSHYPFIGTQSMPSLKIGDKVIVGWYHYQKGSVFKYRFRDVSSGTEGCTWYFTDNEYSWYGCQVCPTRHPSDKLFCIEGFGGNPASIYFGYIESTLSAELNYKVEIPFTNIYHTTDINIKAFPLEHGVLIGIYDIRQYPLWLFFPYNEVLHLYMKSFDGSMMEVASLNDEVVVFIAEKQGLFYMLPFDFSKNESGVIAEGLGYWSTSISYSLQSRAIFARVEGFSRASVDLPEAESHPQYETAWAC